MQIINLVGKRFGRLVVLHQDVSRKGRTYWLCQCDCGGKKSIWGYSLYKKEGTRSCGCLMREYLEQLSANAVSRTPTHRSWKKMWRRCTDKKCDQYKWYGGKGIRVCVRWKDYSKFLLDMGERPEGKTIGRKNHKLGYSPKNCEWQTWSEQGNNHSNSRWIRFGGERLTLTQWSRKVGISEPLLWHRLNKGWPVKKALITPVNKNITGRYRVDK